jgi:hypothetical protein
MTVLQSRDASFYQNLGKLFYAIAAIDKTVRDEEFYALITVVKNKWSAVNAISEAGEFPGEASIINTFRWLRDDDEYNAQTCFDSFIAYMRAHPELFTDTINTLILDTAGAIASAFSSKNKAELIGLAKLDIELKRKK